MVKSKSFSQATTTRVSRKRARLEASLPEAEPSSSLLPQRKKHKSDETDCSSTTFSVAAAAEEAHELIAAAIARPDDSRITTTTDATTTTSGIYNNNNNNRNHECSSHLPPPPSLIASMTAELPESPKPTMLRRNLGAPLLPEKAPRQRRSSFGSSPTNHRCTAPQLQTKQQKPTQSPPSSSSPQAAQRFYGDIVNGLMMAMLSPFFVWKLLAITTAEENDRTQSTTKSSSSHGDPLAHLIVVAIVGSAVFQCFAWFQNCPCCSRLGFLGNLVAGPAVEFRQWPITFSVICPMSMGGVLVMCLANTALSLREQLIRFALILLVASYVSLQSPRIDFVQDALPYLGGSLLMGLVGIYLLHFQHGSISINYIQGTNNGKEAAPLGIFVLQKEELMVHFARLMLAAIYAHHTFQLLMSVFVHETNSEIIRDQGWALTKATMVAGVGSVATGVFKTNIDQKEQLEELVEERTQEIHAKSKELRRINIAFDACETAIAITDASRSIVWANPAFEALARKTNRQSRHRRRLVAGETYDPSDGAAASNVSRSSSSSSLGRQLTDAIVLDGHTNETKLRGAFDFSSPRQDEIEICYPDSHQTGKGSTSSTTTKSNYRVEVTPFADCDNCDHPHNFDNVLAFDSSDGERSNVSKLFLVALHDITADRAREKAEHKAREEALLSKAMKDSMVTLTHELRTPLQGIMGITSILMDHKDFSGESKKATGASFSKDAMDSLKLIMASSSLLLNLINNLLDIKKATANMMDEFDLSPLLAVDPIQDAVDFCNPLASISNVTIAMDYRGKTANAFVNANALRLQQVLINMISNAIKYTERGTTISVSTRFSTVGNTIKSLRTAIACSSDWEGQASYTSESSNTAVLVFSVSDSGPGIERSQARRLFRRYARLDRKPTRTLGSNTIGQPSGTGLGLHLCQMFVQRMGGWIWVENNVSSGATFSFCIPLAGLPEEVPQSSAIDSSSIVTRLRAPLSQRRNEAFGGVQHRSQSIDYKNLRVLVVDDTLINRKVLDRMLKKIGVVGVRTVESGEDAMEELFSSGNEYDLVITDLQMPGMSGTELTEAIFRRRKPTDFPPLVVVGLTADTSPGMAEKCTVCGMSDLLYKPMTLVEIKDYFQRTIRKLQPGQWRRAER